MKVTVERFSSAICDEIRYYVYALFDPKNPHIPFYIGKGKGNRLFSHMKGAAIRQNDEEVDPKTDLIRKILSRRSKQFNRVGHVIIRHGLTENEAILLESSLIDLINYIRPESLKNIVSGHGAYLGFNTAEDIVVNLSAQDMITEEPVMIIKIERLWAQLLDKHGLSTSIPEPAIYQATRRAWRINLKRAKKIRYVLAVSRGIVRAVFEPDRWMPINNSDRKQFFGKVAPNEVADQFLGKSVAHHMSAGSQNPIRYLNVQ